MFRDVIYQSNDKIFTLFPIGFNTITLQIFFLSFPLYYNIVMITIRIRMGDFSLKFPSFPRGCVVYLSTSHQIHKMIRHEMEN